MSTLDARPAAAAAADRLLDLFGEVTLALRERRDVDSDEGRRVFVHDVVAAHTYYQSTVNDALPRHEAAPIETAEGRMRALLAALHEGDVDVAAFLSEGR
ncbi:hypothetical protein ACRAWC_01465 [Leifsonia sp. L25]|uniref:hypothetical protein n=1 Tax=Actinomycetes TaxID=1760 RepID=UPI003D69C800